MTAGGFQLLFFQSFFQAKKNLLLKIKKKNPFLLNFINLFIWLPNTHFFSFLEIRCSCSFNGLRKVPQYPMHDV